MPTPVEDILKDIGEMGYVTVVPGGVHTPSFYKLDDGTIVAVTTRVNHLLPGTKKPSTAFVNTSTEIQVFVPQIPRNGNRNRIAHSGIITSSAIIDDDVSFAVLREDFNVYDLSDGKALGVKTTVSQISRRNVYSPRGEPVYDVNSHPVYKITSRTRG